MNDMIDKARAAIQASSKESSVYIGCDSIRFSKKTPIMKNGENVLDKRGRKTYRTQWYARYSTVVIVHMDSNRGCKLFHDTVDMEDYGNLRSRLMTEVQHAVEVGSALIDDLGGRHMEIHLDINPDPLHKSNIAVKEALGYVRGMNMEARIKPESFAATHCADHLARGKLSPGALH